MYAVVSTVGDKASKNFASNGIPFSPFSNKVKTSTEIIPDMITGIPRLPSNPNACPVDFALGRLSV
jgi:hypothetical protein